MHLIENVCWVSLLGNLQEANVPRNSNSYRIVVGSSWLLNVEYLSRVHLVVTFIWLGYLQQTTQNQFWDFLNFELASWTSKLDKDNVKEKIQKLKSDQKW